MNRIIYLLSGPSHAPNLVCSVHTLRKHWEGRVDVFTWKESAAMMEYVTRDDRLGVHMIPWEPLFRGRQDVYCDKTRLIQTMPPEDVVLFLDADTTIHGDLTPLFDWASQHGFCAGQWNDWVTTGHYITGRLKTLTEFKSLPLGLLDNLLFRSWPSVNSGIFSAKPDSPVLPVWHEWTMAAKTTWIPDEKTLHLCMAKFLPTDQFVVAVGGRWNCSPKYQPKSLKDENVVIRHFHGDSNLRPTKTLRGVHLWWPVYQKCLGLNLGGIADWRKGLNRHLDLLENNQADIFQESK